MNNRLEEFKRRMAFERKVGARLSSSLGNGLTATISRGVTLFTTGPGKKVLVEIDHAARIASLHSSVPYPVENLLASNSFFVERLS
ncbi:MAG TPA: hypothetical protein VK255_00715 [Patescibacteria group bacterium]|nr:hypothetical protein [Patescibacteria group bacterium]